VLQDLDFSKATIWTLFKILTISAEYLNRQTVREISSYLASALW